MWIQIGFAYIENGIRSPPLPLIARFTGNIKNPYEYKVLYPGIFWIYSPLKVYETKKLFSNDKISVRLNTILGQVATATVQIMRPYPI